MSRRQVCCLTNYLAHSNPKFDLTHEKSMVVDDKIAFIMSFNGEPKDLRTTYSRLF
jgi:phosphatidylserine/phosphatidylglycerophosphate/cardiolipin synthase-like enzyme